MATIWPILIWPLTQAGEVPGSGAAVAAPRPPEAPRLGPVTLALAPVPAAEEPPAVPVDAPDDPAPPPVEPCLMELVSPAAGRPVSPAFIPPLAAPRRATPTRSIPWS